MIMKTKWEFKFDSPNDPRINEIVQKAKKDVQDFVDTFDLTDKSLDNVIKLIEFDASEGLIEVYYYLAGIIDTDKTNVEAQKRNSLLSNEWSDIYKPWLVFSDFYKNIGEETLRVYAQQCPEYANKLNMSADNLKYDTFDISIKDVLQEYDKVSESIDSLHKKYRDSLKYVFLGEEISSSELSEYQKSDDERTRKAAYTVRHDMYARPESKLVLGALYSTVCASNTFSIKQHGLLDVTHSRSLSENVSPDLIPNLIINVKKQYPIYQRFLKLKAKLLNKEILDIYDMSVSVKKTDNTKYSFEEGYAIYHKIIKEFDQQFADISDFLVSNGKVDVYPSVNKTSGAYCRSHQHSDISVLLNWTNSYDDISTLAHELGHAVHGTLVKKQKRYNADYPLCFAETASIMNETILLNSFLKDNPEHKEQYLLSYLEDMFGTIFRQIMYISFEYRAHKRYLDGEVLNHDDYSKMWEEETKEMYGDAVHYGNYEFNGWSMIPHIFDSPFYCYSYAFGNILSIALYNMYSTSTDKTVFVDKYKEFLSAGESDTPENLLKIFELSYKEDFMYDNAFTYISDLLASLE